MRSHNLVRLSEMAGVNKIMPDGYLDFLADITPFAIEARYGAYKAKFSEIINRQAA